MGNKALIDKFLVEMKASQMSEKRIVKYRYFLPKLSKWLGKPFKEVTKDDMIKLMVKVQDMELKEWTKVTYRSLIKRFYKWLYGNEDYPDVVRWIKTGMSKSKMVLPNQLLTEDDVNVLINSATNLRDKAFVRVLYESGCRIGELVGDKGKEPLKIKHVTFDEYSPVIIVAGKTGGRRVRIIDKDGLLKMWIESHPFRDDPEAPIFCSFASNRKNKPLEYHAIMYLLKELKSRSGLKKPVNPHHFRHSRATHLAGKLTESQMDNMFGWIQGSKMAAVYVHLSGRDLDEPLLKMNGLLDEEIKSKEKIDTLAMDFIKLVLKHAEKDQKLKSKLGQGLKEIIQSRDLQKLF